MLSVFTLYLSILFIVGGLPITASADETLSRSTIDELVVVARKKEEQLFEVPVSVSVFSNKVIQELGLNGLADIARYTPGFSSSAATGRQPASNRPSIRGLTTIRNGIANTSAATVFIDGVYVGGSPQSTELTNLDRIEILRGPQTALYGRGTYAGVINYITRRPGDQLDGELTATVAEDETNELSVWLGGPLINDQFAFFLAAGHRKHGAEYVNIRDGSDIGGEKSNEFTGKLYWTPTDNLDISLKLGLQQTDDDHFAAYLQPRTENDCCFRTAEAPRAREYFTGESLITDQVNLYTDLLDAAGGSGTELNRQLAALNIDWTMPNGFTLTSLTGSVRDKIDRGYDTSYAAYDPFPIAFPWSDMRGVFNKIDRLGQSDLSQELRLSSSDYTPLSWTTGLYFFSGDLEKDADNRVYLDGGNLVVTPGGDLAKDKIRNLAVFGGVEWDIDGNWTTGMELRWANDEINVTTHTNDAGKQLLDKFSKNFRSLTPRFTVSYNTNSDRNYYLSIANGVKPGDFNPKVPELADGSPDESYRAVDEEIVWNYELGLKGQWWQGKLTTALAVYYQDIDNQQLTTLVELPDGETASIIQNVGKTEVYGFESDFQLLLTRALAVNASYAYTHAEIREHISIEEADLRGSDGSFAQNQALGDISGHDVPRIPQHMASIAIRYERPFSDRGLGYLLGDYTYESSRFAQEHNLIETGNQNLVGLRAGLKTGQWEVNIWVKNLFDEHTPADVFRYFDRRSGSLPSFPQQGSRPSSSPRGFVVTLPRQRQFGTTVHYRF
ncbi:MAG: TonB-dependent receptor [Gammaproteobacteria bacterium]|nr:TonB-dependent receptor [Gammaproteobacteria bacterium]